MQRRARRWMPMFWGDYLGDTLHLEPLEHAAYLLLIGHYWMHGGLPADDADRQAVTGLTKYQWRKHGATVRAFFQPQPDGTWKHKRIEAELALTVTHNVSAAKRKRTSRARARIFQKRDVDSLKTLAFSAPVTDTTLKKERKTLTMRSATISRTAEKQAPRPAGARSLQRTLTARSRAPANGKERRDPAAEARCSWERDLAHELAGDAYAAAIDRLAEDHALCLMATTAELEAPGAGVKAVLETLRVGA